MRRKIISFLIWLIVLSTLGLLGWVGYQYYDYTYLVMDGQFYRRDLDELDFAGRNLKQYEKLTDFYDLRKVDLRKSSIGVEEYDWLRDQLPNCDILWYLPFQGEYLSLDTESIAVQSLTDSEVVLLDHLTKLRSVDAWDCGDLPQLLQLKQRRPECDVLYYVKIEGTNWSSDVENVALENADAQEIQEKLTLLPMMKTLHLTGKLPSMGEIMQLQNAFPDTEITWEYTVGSRAYGCDTKKLDLTGIPMTMETGMRMLAYFPELTNVVAQDCRMSNLEKIALCQAYPNCTFLWELDVFGVNAYTDTDFIDLTGREIPSLEELEELLVWFPNLKQVDMVSCGFDNESMEALNRRHENIKFVWAIRVGGILLRTDATYYIPVKWGFKVTDRDLEPLKYFHDMVAIDLGHQAITCCPWVAEMPHLRFLLLADTQLNDISPVANHKELVYLEIFMTRVTDLSPLVSCTALEDLNLCYTYADCEPLKEMTWLKRIWWSGSWKASVTLPEALPNTYCEFHSNSSTGEGWREGKLYYEMRDYFGMYYMVG